MQVFGPIEPQPPQGIRYMLGGETWLAPEDRSPLRLHVEEWGNLGPMELRPDVKPNKAGFRVRATDYPAPSGACGFTTIDGTLHWTDVDQFGRTFAERYGQR